MCERIFAGSHPLDSVDTCGNMATHDHLSQPQPFASLEPLQCSQPFVDILLTGMKKLFPLTSVAFTIAHSIWSKNTAYL